MVPGCRHTSHLVPDAFGAVVATVNFAASGTIATAAAAADVDGFDVLDAVVAPLAVPVGVFVAPAAAAPMPIRLPTALSSLAALADFGPAFFFIALLTAAENIFGLNTDSRRCGIGLAGRPAGLANAWPADGAVGMGAGGVEVELVGVGDCVDSGMLGASGAEAEMVCGVRTGIGVEAAADGGLCGDGTTALAG